MPKPLPKRRLPSWLTACLLIGGLALLTSLALQSCTRPAGPPRIRVGP